ncbi:SDR family oxidoreductase [Mesorhizobium calcicola]|uniref:SDR family oxidoreductase n=1 Tax=Mesorhizobium calcicola TaxID=1300310 RepID=A0ABW4WCC1_9HYPH
MPPPSTASIGLTRSAAVEYATKGLRINAICPAHTRTAMVDSFVRNSGAPEAEALGRADTRRADEAGGRSR